MRRTMRIGAMHCNSVIGSCSLLVCLTLGCSDATPDDAGAELVHEQVVTDVFDFPPRRKVDLLFVIDNSASMGAEQAQLAANFDDFIEVLDDPEVDADHRIALTTTDVGGPACPDTTPEDGALQLSSCTTRLDEFVRDGLDLRDVACTDTCTLDAGALEILPTTTGFDDVARVRPWLERAAGRTNLPATTAMADAFACFAPQGVRGCAFESPLEAMHRALDRMADVDDPAYGFLRSDAILLVVFVTDEMDCSHAPAWADMFSPQGNKVFWSDPSAAGPSSALCWNAGVACEGEDSEFTCRTLDKDIEGAPTDDPTRAVLHPLSRYVDRLQGVEDQKREINPDLDVIVSLVGGVGHDGSIDFDVGTTPDLEFGDHIAVAPGCTVGDAEALPPMRLVELVEALSPTNEYSVCSDDYTPALDSIAFKLKSQIQPRCFSACADDREPATLLREPECRVELRSPGGPGEPLPACLRDAQGRWLVDPLTHDYALPEGVDTCHVLLVDDAGLSDDPNDDLSGECSDSGHVLELKVTRRPGTYLPDGGQVALSCLVSDTPSIDCPGLSSTPP